MTREEYYTEIMAAPGPFRFDLYNGDYLIGTILDDSMNELYYFIPHNKRGLLKTKSKEDIGEKIDLRNIVEYSHYEIQPMYFKTYQHPKGKATKMIIIGAGASFDFSSMNQGNDRPPLSNNLFSEAYTDILNIYPGARLLSEEILHYPDIENYFQTQWLAAKEAHNPMLLYDLINTQYYIHDLFRRLSGKYKNYRGSNYLVLAKKIREYLSRSNEDIILVSFNYDTLFDYALEQAFKLNFNTTDDYTNYENSFYLFKPHGSCNWKKTFTDDFLAVHTVLKEVNGMERTPRHIYDLKLNLHDINKYTEDKITVLNSPLVNPMYHLYTYYPSVLLPFKDKDEFVMPDSHTALFGHTLKDIEDILIIGWKGTEANFQRFVKQRLGDKKVNITLVSQMDKLLNHEMHLTFPNATINHHVDSDSIKQITEKQTSTFSGFIKDSSKGNIFFN